jgi:hypothetical protein
MHCLHLERQTLYCQLKTLGEHSIEMLVHIYRIPAARQEVETKPRLDRAALLAENKRRSHTYFFGRIPSAHHILASSCSHRMSSLLTPVSSYSGVIILWSKCERLSLKKFESDQQLLRYRTSLFKKFESDQLLYCMQYVPCSRYFYMLSSFGLRLRLLRSVIVL